MVISNVYRSLPPLRSLLRRGNFLRRLHSGFVGSIGIPPCERVATCSASAATNNPQRHINPKRKLAAQLRMPTSPREINF